MRKVCGPSVTLAVSLKTASEATIQQLLGEALPGSYWLQVGLTSVLSVVQTVQHDQLHRG